MFDRLVGRTIFANANRVVCPDENGFSTTQRGQPNGTSHVVTENQKCPTYRQGTTVKGQAIADGSHGMLSNSKEDLSTFRAIGALHAVPTDRCTSVASQIGAATNQSGNHAG
jgi:hypothetical protein